MKKNTKNGIIILNKFILPSKRGEKIYMKKFVITIILLFLFLGTISTYSTTYAIDFSFEGIKNLADDFIERGEEGGNYINSDSMAGLINRNRNNFNNNRSCNCFSRDFNNWNTIYDSNTRRGSKTKNKISRTSNSRNCYIRCLGNLELNFNLIVWNIEKHKGGFKWEHIIYHVM